jgi:hypothetical protein
VLATRLHVHNLARKSSLEVGGKSGDKKQGGVEKRKKLRMKVPTNLS